MWFDRSDSARVTPAVFSDRSGDRSEAEALAAWVSVRATRAQAVPRTSGEVRLPPDHPDPPPAPMPTAVSPQRESPCAKAEDQSVRDAMLAQQKDALDALDTAVRGIVAVQSRLGMDLERQLVVLAGRIARRVVHREVSLDPAVLLALAREGMNALGASKGVVVRIGRVEDPGLIESLQLRLEDYAPDARLIIEAGRPPGYCTVEAEAGSVDESVDTRLDNVLRNLIGDASVDEG